MIFVAFHDDRNFWHLSLCHKRPRDDRAVGEVNAFFIDQRSARVCKRCLRKANELRGPQRGDS